MAGGHGTARPGTQGVVRAGMPDELVVTGGVSEALDLARPLATRARSERGKGIEGGSGIPDFV